MVKQLGYCKGNFSLCKTYEDEGLKAISACSESSADLTAKAAALTANSAGLTAAKTTASKLSGNRGKPGKQKGRKNGKGNNKSIKKHKGSGRQSRSLGRKKNSRVTECARVIAKITALLKLVDQNPASTKISTAAAEVTNITVTCTDAEKTSLRTLVLKKMILLNLDYPLQVTSLAAAIVTTASELSTVQADLQSKARIQ